MRHVAYVLADFIKLTSAEDRHLATRRPAEPRQSAQECGLAGAVSSENGIELSTNEFCRYAAKREKAAKLFCEIRYCDDGRGSGFSQWNRSE